MAELPSARKLLLWSLIAISIIQIKLVASSIEAYDCSSKKSLVTTIKNRGVQECDTPDPEDSAYHRVQIIAKVPITPIEIIRCKVKVER